MIDRAVDMFHMYHGQFVSWYNGLETYFQYGFIIASGIVGFVVIVLFAMHKLTR